MVVACLALIIALSSAGYAAVVLPANSVGTAQLKKNAVTAKKIKRGNVTRGKIAANAVNGAKVAANSLSGLDINEASLGQVPLAANADKLDGFDANELVRGRSGIGTVNVATTPVSATLFTATAPKAGGLLLNLSFGCRSFIGTTNTDWFVEITVDGVAKGLFGILSFSHAVLATDPADSTSVTAFVPVTAGNHSIGYTATRDTGDGSVDCNINESSLFVPFGNTGVAPTVALTHTERGRGASR
jgi:hypothetical protein